MLIDVSLDQVTTIIFVSSAMGMLLGYIAGRRSLKELVSMGASQGYAAGLQAYEKSLEARGIDVKTLIEGSTEGTVDEYKAGF